MNAYPHMKSISLIILVALSAGPAHATVHLMQIEQVIGGLDPGTAPNYIINVSDLQRVKFGFQGLTYTETPEQLDPADCP